MRASCFPLTFSLLENFFCFCQKFGVETLILGGYMGKIEFLSAIHLLCLKSAAHSQKNATFFLFIFVLIVVIMFVACSTGRCQQMMKLFSNFQQISDVLKDKPSTSTSGGGKKKGQAAFGAYFQ